MNIDIEGPVGCGCCLTGLLLMAVVSLGCIYGIIQLIKLIF